MKQILQNLKNGKTELAEIPIPSVKPGNVLIKTTRSLLSAGTERMLVEFGQANLIQKARAQPDKVKQVLEKISTDGLMPTLETVFNRLDEPLPLGYCNVGTVVEVGVGVTEFSVGDRVASNGNHAEFVCVPKNLCAKIPENVSDEDATFTVLGAIGLQGVRLAEPQLGQSVVVFGAGLIGLVVVQLLLASGCKVLAIDLDEQRLAMAKSFGAETMKIGVGDPVNFAKQFSNGHGVDSVIITASAKTDEIVHQSAQMCRKRGKIVLVGVVGLSLLRSDFYEKELSFQVSCSYGPGRYDKEYELEGKDYPFGFVRWTEKRNFESVLGAIESQKIDVAKLITHRKKFEESVDAYKVITGEKSSLGVILEYSGKALPKRSIEFGLEKKKKTGNCVAGIIGAGNFSKMTMVPALAKTEACLKYISARTNGAAAAHIAKKFSVENATTDLEMILKDTGVNTVFIATNHNSHYSLCKRFLESGKHIFVEKPLCLKPEELVLLVDLCNNSDDYSDQHIMVGFNRRFSPHIKKIQELLAGRSEPISMIMNINAGVIPSDHWLHDPEIGGGRIIGEACHFIDLLTSICGAQICKISGQFMLKANNENYDTISISMTFKDGSLGVVNYFGNGNKGYPKETLEVYSEGRILNLDNFRHLSGYGFKGFKKFKTWSMEKGHSEQFTEFIDRIENSGVPLIPFKELVQSTVASFAALKSGKEGKIIELDEYYVELFGER